MNENEVMEMLAEDISRLRLPPISEKVLLAMREKRHDILEMNKPPVPTEKPHKVIPTKYIFAAMLTLLAVSVPIIIVMTNHAPISDLPNAPVLPGSSETVSVTESQIVISTEEPKTTLEQIKLKQIYGEIALSAKSEEELEMLLVTYSKENSVYEDEKYIYNFDSQGRLIEMRKAAFGDEEGQPVDEQAISVKVNALLKEYYSDWSENEYVINIEKNEDSRMLWTVDVIKANDDLTKEMIYITFERTGNLKGIVNLGSKEDVGVISKAEAVQIALNEIRSGKYNSLEFDNKDVSVTVSNKEIYNELYYEISLDKIPYDIVDGEIYYKMFIFLLNCNTGDYSLVDQSV